MDEEQVNKFNEALANARAELDALNRAMGNFTTSMGGTSAAAEKAARAQTQSATASDRDAKATEKEAKEKEKNANVTAAQTRAAEQLNSALNAMSASLGNAVKAATSFADALLSPEKNFSKFKGSIDATADAAAGIANEFGILGKIVGMAIKAQSELTKKHLEQADNMYKGIDAINKMGAAGTMTVRGFTEMAHKVGYTSAELDKLTKPIESMKGGLISLGGTTGKGVKAFMELADVGEETRRKFRNLGISQEELTQTQADYISLQRMSGKVISDYSKTTGQLKKDSLEYTKNLTELAALTGKSVEEAKKEQAAAQATFAMQVRNAKDANEMAKLDKIIKSDASASDKAAAKARLEQIEQERKVREKMTDSLTKSGLDITQIESFQTFLETGAKTEEFAKAFGSLQGLDVDDIRRRLLEAQKTGADTTAIMAEFETKYRDGVLKNVDRFGKNIMITGEQSARDLGLTSKNITNSVARVGQDIGDAGKETKANIEGAMEGKVGGEEDKMQKARNDLYEMQIREAVALDKMLLATNPIAEGAMPALLDVSKKLYDILFKIAEFLQKWWKELLIVFGALSALKLGKWAAGFGKELAGVAGKLGKFAAGIFSKGGAAAAGGVASKAMGALGGAARAAGKFGKFIPGVGTALTAGMAAYDAYQGFKADKDAPLSERLKNAGSSALSGATFGLLGSSPEEIKARKEAAAAGAAGAKPASPTDTRKVGDLKDSEMQDLAKKIADAKVDVDLTKDTKIADILAKIEKAKTGTGGQPRSFESFMSPEALKRQEEATKRYEEGSKALSELTKKQGEAAAKKPEEKQTTDTKAETERALAEFHKKQEELQKKTQEFLAKGTGAGGSGNIAPNLLADVQKKQKEAMEKYTESLSKNGVDVSGLLEKQKMAGLQAADMTTSRLPFGSDDIKKQNDELFKKMGTDILGTTDPLKEFGLQSKGMVDVQKMTANIQNKVNDELGKTKSTLTTSNKEFEKLNSQLKNTGPAMDKMMKDVAKNVEVSTKTMFAGFGNMAKGSYEKAGGVVPKGTSGLDGANALLAKNIGKLNTATANIGNRGASSTSGGGGAASSAMTARAAPPPPSSGSSTIPSDPSIEKDPETTTSDTADQAPKLATNMPKNVTLGPGVDISGVESPLLSKFFTAAGEFGKPININSAYRGDEKQAELWVRGRVLGDPGVHTPARPKNDTNIVYQGKEYQVAGSGRGSKHREGEALDISADRDSLDPLLEKYGLHRPYKQKDPPHVELKAEKGGIASGPKTGFPTTLHGTEIIVPLDPNSVLAELGKKSKTEIESQVKQAMSSTPATTSNEGMKEMMNLNQSLMEMLAGKLDNMINKLDTSNDTQEKILKYSQA